MQINVTLCVQIVYNQDIKYDKYIYIYIYNQDKKYRKKKKS